MKCQSLFRKSENRLHEMSNLIFWEKLEKIKMSSAEMYAQHAERKNSQLRRIVCT